MEANDHELIIKYMQKDIRLKRLYTKHKKLDQELIDLSNRIYLSAADQARQQKLKMQKLKGVEEMLSIVKECYQDAA